MNKIGDLHDLKVLLDAGVEFPMTYTFKFIVEKEQVQELLGRLEGNRNSVKESKTGKYTSVTSIKDVQSSQEIINIYQNVSDIKGIFSL